MILRGLWLMDSLPLEKDYDYYALLGYNKLQSSKNGFISWTEASRDYTCLQLLLNEERRGDMVGQTRRKFKSFPCSICYAF